MSIFFQSGNFYYRYNNANKQEKFLKDLIDGIQTSEMIMSILILLASHTMSELALIIKKISNSFDHSEFFFMHWTKLFPKNWTVLVSPSWDNAKSPPTATAQIGLFLYSAKEWYRPALKKDSPKQLNSLEIIYSNAWKRTVNGQNSLYLFLVFNASSDMVWIGIGIKWRSL